MLIIQLLNFRNVLCTNILQVSANLRYDLETERQLKWRNTCSSFASDALNSLIQSSTAELIENIAQSEYRFNFIFDFYNL